MGEKETGLWKVPMKRSTGLLLGFLLFFAVSCQSSPLNWETEEKEAPPEIPGPDIHELCDKAEVSMAEAIRKAEEATAGKTVQARILAGMSFPCIEVLTIKPLDPSSPARVVVIHGKTGELLSIVRADLVRQQPAGSAGVSAPRRSGGASEEEEECICGGDPDCPCD